MGKEIFLVPFLIKNYEKINKILLKKDKILLRGINYQKCLFDLPVYYENELMNCYVFLSGDKEEEEFINRMKNLVRKGIGNPSESEGLTKYFIKK